MSNFDFLDNYQAKSLSSEYLKIYEFACKAEGLYYVNRIYCAVYARFALEQLCDFIARHKLLKLVGRRKGVGYYWNPTTNYLLMHHAVNGHEQLDHFKRINEITRVYMHSFDNPFFTAGVHRRDREYEELLEELFYVLFWFYTEFLGQKSSLSYNSFDWSKVKADPSMIGDIPDIEESTEEQIAKFKEAFPKLKLESACNITREGDMYILTDRFGQKVGEYYSKSDYDEVAGDREQLFEQKEKLERQVKESYGIYQRNLYDKEAQIGDLRNKLSVLEDSMLASNRDQNDTIDDLERELKKALKDRDDISVSFQKEYDLLRDKYDKVLDQLERKGDMYREAKKEVERLISERNDIKKEFTNYKAQVTREFVASRQELNTAKLNLERLKQKDSQSASLIRELEQSIQNKEDEIKKIESRLSEREEELASEQERLILRYKEKEIGLETLIKNLVAENSEYREEIAKAKSRDDSRYLMMIQGNLMRINNSYALYAQSQSEQKLRSMLLRIKEHYDEEISLRDEALRRQEDILRQQDEELRRRDEEIEFLSEENRRQREREEERARSQREFEDNLRLENERWKASVEAKVNAGVSNKTKKRSLWIVPAVASVLLGLTAIGAIWMVARTGGEPVQPEPEAQDETESIAGIPEELLSSMQEYDIMEAQDDTEVPIISVDDLQMASEGEILSTDYDSQQAEESSVDRLEELINQRNQEVATPKRIEDIQGINQGLADFMRNSEYIDLYRSGYADAQYLTTTHVHSIGPGAVNLYTISDKPWLSFCYVHPGNSALNGCIYYVEPSVLSSELSRESTIQDVARILGNPRFEYPATPKELSFYADVNNGSQFVWEFDDSYEDLNSAKVYVYADDRGIFDYVEIYVSPARDGSW